MKPVAYEGKENYIFISYAHKDSEAVFEVLRELDRKGYRIWYDDGIAPGSEWPEDIARHLDASQMVIAFITPSSMASRNCRREINFALSKEKPFLSVVLEKTNMPLGMEMQLSAQQSILRYNYASREAFIDKILLCPDIAPCRRPEEVVPEVKSADAAETKPTPTLEFTPAGPAAASAFTPARPETVPAPVLTPAEPASAMDLASTGAAETTSAPAFTPAGSESASAAAAPAVPEPSKKGLLGKKKKPAPAEKPAVKEKPVSGETAAKKPPVPLFIAAAAVALAAIIGAVVVLGGQFKTSWGKTIKRNETSIYVSRETLTQSDIENILKMKKLNTVSLMNCDLSACDMSGLRAASNDLKWVYLTGSTGINDYGFLSDLPLYTLQAENNSALSDISNLNLSSMNTLNLDDTGVTDLSCLAGSSVNYLSFQNTGVTDLSFAAEMEKLAKINGAGSGVTSLAPLAGLTGLTEINFSGCPLTELPDGLASLKLTSAALASCGLDNEKLGVLSNCTILKSLDLSGNPDLTDPREVLKLNNGTLEQLDLSETGISLAPKSDTEEAMGALIESISNEEKKESTAQILSECKQLKALSISGIPAGTLDFAAGMTSLEVLKAVNCKLTDISGLSNCKGLKIILLSFNNISDITPIGQISPDTTVTIVDLSFNDLADVTNLAQGKYRAILLHGNNEKIALTIPQGALAYEISVPWCEGITGSVLSSQGDFGEIFLLDCPTTEILNAQEAFGRGYVKTLTEGELMEILLNNGTSYSIDLNYRYPYSVYQSR